MSETRGPPYVAWHRDGAAVRVSVVAENCAAATRAAARRLNRAPGEVRLRLVQLWAVESGGYRVVGRGPRCRVDGPWVPRTLLEWRWTFDVEDSGSESLVRLSRAGVPSP